MRTTQGRIDNWNPQGLPADFAGLFVHQGILTISNDGNRCKLDWSDADGNPCSMTLTGNLPGKAAGAPVTVTRSGCPDLNVAVVIESTKSSNQKRLEGELRLPASGTPPGTFAATLDPN